MKRITKYRHLKLNTVVLFFLVVFMQGCSDFLDITPEGQQNSENFFNQPTDYESALTSVYDMLSSTYLNVILGEIASDNTLCGGENPTDVLAWQQIDQMIHTPDNNELRNIFKWMYAGIARANYIMEFQNKISFDGKADIIAQTKFLRAYFYFELVKFFGDVPLYIDKRITLEESQTIGRTSKTEVYAQIEKDLQEAASVLPATQSQNGRATKGAAQALLGKVYLYQEKFTEAQSALESVINSNVYQLMSDFSTIFLKSGENNAESVFEVQYFEKEGASFDCFQCSEGNIAVGFSGPRFLEGDYAPYAHGYSFNVPVQDLVDAFSAGDARKDATIFDIDAFVQTHPDVKFSQGNQHTGYFNKKYIPYEEAGENDPHLTHGTNYRAIRYADVLLMAAEAYSRASTPDDAKAQTYLNQVRARAGLANVSLTGNDLIEAIWDERRLELAGEGHRFFDQVRTQKTGTISGFTVGKNEIFPISRIEIELAGNRWSQNPNY